MKSKKLPRGLRNNNPLNIRWNPKTRPWQGQKSHDGEFAIFETMEDGYRAAFRVLDSYNKKHNIYSVREIIYRWAPPQDHNHTRAYIERVCKEASLRETDIIVVDSWIEEKREDAMWLVWAMAKVENGDAFISYADMETIKKGYYKAFKKYS
ncbi:MAG: structural protein P5 [Bacteroidaceae bacterium]|nr:structural protein P5 [Bacteroidaceae bacterium]